MIKFFGILTIPLLFLISGSVGAQEIGTIGVGDINFRAKATKLRATENIISALDSGINLALIKTRKFTVLDYAQLTGRLEAKDLTLDGYYTNKYREAGIYDQVGLDYIFTADVTEFDVLTQTRGKSETSVAVIDIDYKMYGVADVTEDSAASVTAQVSAKIGAGDQDAMQDLLDKVIEKAVNQVTQHLISGLFPVRVMRINEDESVTLNYGEGVLAVGDTVLVYAKDANIILDESGEAIGDAIATLQIIRAEKKFATAQVLEGKDLLKKGQPGQLLNSLN